MLRLIILATALLSSVFIYRKLSYVRFKQYANFPQLPTSLLLGHLKIYNEITKRGEIDRDHGNLAAIQCETFLI